MARSVRPSDAAEDARLVAAAAAGDRRAFADLYRRHLDSVYARLTRVVGPVPERDDLVQHIFLDVYRALPRFRGEAAFTTFLHRIVLNVACEHLERRRRGRGRSEPLDDRQLDTLMLPAASPEQRARHREELRRLFARLGTLSAKRRAAFVLVAVEGLTLEEAAALLGINVPAVKQRVLEARRELAQALDREPKEST
jgi:RNA polymerase sigma-70 factor (ECF subfamily)